MLGLSVLFRKEGICRVWLAFDPYILLFSAETIEPIINNSSAMNKSRDYDLLHCWLRTGLLTSVGEKWKERRKMITPAFHYSILNDFIPIFDRHSKLLVKQLQKYENEKAFDLVPIIRLFSLDVICETAMGVKLGSQESEACEYAEAVANFSDIFIKRVMRPWLQNDFIFSQTSDGNRLREVLRTLHGLTRKVIRQKKQKFTKGDRNETVINNREDLGCKRKKALLDLLLEKQLIDNSLSDNDICEEAHTFMFEGHDTTSMGICWLLYHLGCNPQIQENVYEELQAIFGSDKKREVTAGDLKEMKYLERVIKESQRLSPPVPVISRLATEDIDIKRYTIPRGSTFVLFIYALHRDPAVFPNPDVFDPDRFLPENCKERHPFSYVPFSAGSRNCIGQRFAMAEIKVCISNVIRNYYVESIDPPDSILCSALMILRSEGGLRLKLTKRS